MSELKQAMLCILFAIIIFAALAYRGLPAC
jgi:hypothetical protein